jgi:hypothetical protein
VVSSPPPIEALILQIFPTIVVRVVDSINEQTLGSVRELRVVPQFAFFNNLFEVNRFEAALEIWERFDCREAGLVEKRSSFIVFLFGRL